MDLTHLTLQEKIQCFQKVFDEINAGVLIVSNEYKMLYMNQKAQQLLGTETVTDSYQNWPSFFHIYTPDKQSMLSAEQLPFYQAIHGEGVTNLELFVANPSMKDGTYINANSVSIKDEKNTILGAIVIINDITHLKKIEYELKESNERFELIMRATNDAVYDWDMAKGELWWSPGTTFLFGYPPEEILPSIEWWDDHIHPEDKDKTVQSLTQAMQGTASNWTAEYRFKRRDGTYAQVLDRGFFVRDENGKCKRMIGSMQDISARKNAESEAQQKNAELQHTIDIMVDREKQMVDLKDKLKDLQDKTS
jgi:PAS domain S-box-containing protein